MTEWLSIPFWFLFPFVLVSYGCKWLQTWWLKIRAIYSLIILSGGKNFKIRTIGAKGQWSHTPSTASRGSISCLFQHLLVPDSFVNDHVTPLSTSLHMPSLCVWNVSDFHKDDCDPIWGLIQDNLPSRSLT